MSKLSVVILTLNEEKNIGRCIDSVSEVADEIVVVDSFSTDRTEEICREKEVTFIQHAFEGYIEQKNWARKQAAHDYVLSLDADEALSKKLQKNILAIKQKGFECEGYRFNRMTNYCGKWIRHCGWYPDKKLRLWHKDKGEWKGQNPHDRFEMESGAKVQHIDGDILHYSYYTVLQHVTQIVKFSDISAKAKYEKGKNVPFWLMILRPSFVFLKKYIFKLGVLDGYYGFVISRLTAYGIFQKDILLRELNRRKK